MAAPGIGIAITIGYRFFLRAKMRKPILNTDLSYDAFRPSSQLMRYARARRRVLISVSSRSI